MPDYTNPYTGGAPWGMPPFNDNGSGNGEAIKDWLCAPQNGYSAGCLQVIDTYWGEQARDAFIKSAKTEHEQYLCVETVAYHGLYKGKSPVYGAHGNVITICATAGNMAHKIYTLNGKDLGSGYPFYSYDFQNYPYSLMFEYDWLEETAPKQKEGRISDSSVIWTQAYGIIAVRPQDIGTGGNSTHTWDSKSYPKGSSYRIEKAPQESKSEKVTIVKTYREQVEIPDGWDDEEDVPIMKKETIYHGTFYRDETLKSVRIEDEDGYKVIEWQTSTETKPTNRYSGSATWEEVTEHSSETHRGSKSGYTTLSDTEHVLYVLLEKADKTGLPVVSPPQADNNFDYVEEWELNWVNPTLDEVVLPDLITDQSKMGYYKI